jgi:hypothetical protein
MSNEELADILINTFCGIWLSLRATTSPQDLQMYKVQLMKGLVSNGFNDPESMARGVDAIRTNGGQYPPSVPGFIKLCKKPINRPEHALLEYQQSEESTIEQKDEAHKVVSGLKDLLK